MKNSSYNVEIIRSKRKTISLQISRDGRIVVRAPMRMRAAEIEAFVSSRSDWIEKSLRKMQALKEKTADVEPLTDEELKALAKRAREYIPQRVSFYAPLVGVQYGNISIRAQKTRWGSCSSKGNLNFNCLLMLAPAEVIDSVVVHELCHRKEMNHSARFYNEVRRVFPDYDKFHKWLKANGELLLARLPVRNS